VHLSLANIALVAAGGAAGTGLRYLITLAVPPWAGVPVATLAINVVGAFLLGVLLELLADRTHDTGWSRRVRLGVGTGGLGGFTTYSALATDTALLAAAHPGRAAGYALATVILGAAASIAGIWLGRGHLRPARIGAVSET
jgi:CrcB protein